MPPVHEIALVDLSEARTNKNAIAIAAEIAILIANEWEPFGLTNARLGLTRDRMLYPAHDEVKCTVSDTGTLQWTVQEKAEQEGLSDEMIAEMDP